jgi:hypothetical protein
VTVSSTLLPPEFVALEPLVERWAVPTMAARLALRINSSAAQRRAFYDAMLPAAGPALEHLSRYTMDDLPADAARLLQLLLTLTEVSLTQEVNTAEVEAVHAQSNRLMRIQKELDGR